MGLDHYQKHFIPLESNPDVFNELIHDLGVSRKLSFLDVVSLDERELLPHPALALILIFPTSKDYESRKMKEDQKYEDFTEDKEIIWFKQTINNACGLYALLHAVCNSEAKDLINPGSLLATLLDQCLPLNLNDRALALLNSDELEAVYMKAAIHGDSVVPNNPEDDVDYHYVCFVKSKEDGHIYELDGDRKCPIDRTVILGPGEDMLAEGALSVLREIIHEEKCGDSGFSLLALVSG